MKYPQSDNKYIWFNLFIGRTTFLSSKTIFLAFSSDSKFFVLTCLFPFGPDKRLYLKFFYHQIYFHFFNFRNKKDYFYEILFPFIQVVLCFVEILRNPEEEIIKKFLRKWKEKLRFRVKDEDPGFSVRLRP